MAQAQCNGSRLTVNAWLTLGSIYYIKSPVRFSMRQSHCGGETMKKNHADLQVFRSCTSQTVKLGTMSSFYHWLSFATETQQTFTRYFISRQFLKTPRPQIKRRSLKNVSEQMREWRLHDRHSQKSGFRRSPSQEFPDSSAFNRRRRVFRLNRSESWALRASQ